MFSQSGWSKSTVVGVCECSFCFLLFLVLVSVFCSLPLSPLGACGGRGHGGSCQHTCRSSSCNQLTYIDPDQPPRPGRIVESVPVRNASQLKTNPRALLLANPVFLLSRLRPAVQSLTQSACQHSRL